MKIKMKIKQAHVEHTPSDSGYTFPRYLRNILKTVLVCKWTKDKEDKGVIMQHSSCIKSDSRQ